MIYRPKHLQTSMAKLPTELIADILSRLLVKSLVRFQCISKPWNDLINSSYFIRKHLERSIQNNTERTVIVKDRSFRGETQEYFSVCFNEDGQFDRAVKILHPLRPLRAVADEIVGCCNGLVCIQMGLDLEEIVIWNPLIRKYKKLPTEPIQSPSGFSEYWVPQLAFGHDPINDDYKVLRVVQFFKSGKFPSAFEIKAYSLKADSWRRVEGEWPYKESYIPTNSESLSSASLNGAVHWLVTPVIEGVHHARTLVAFNLAAEKFRVYMLPVHSATNLALEVLGGRILLRIVGTGNGSGNELIKNLCYHFWAMMEYGVESSWTWLYCDQFECNSKWNLSDCKPLLISEDGNEVLIEQNFRYFYWYDIKKKSRGNKIWKMPRLFQTVTCVGSLVLLHGYKCDSIQLNASSFFYELLHRYFALCI